MNIEELEEKEKEIRRWFFWLDVSKYIIFTLAVLVMVAFTLMCV